jgi:hypothetical protein
MIGFVFSYFIWHYTTSIKEFFGLCRNILWFVYHFFSIDVLSKTLLSPWQRLDEEHHRGEGIQGFFEVFVLNTIMRIVGFLVRSCVIVVGFGCMLAVIVIETTVFAVWIFFSLLLVYY